jgi:murein DD-endopeptidase MepM/ murein hydrolase activator NlpD
MEPKPKGSFARVMLTQAAVCTLLLGGLFLSSKVMPNSFQQLRTSYQRVMQTDMTAKEVWEAARAVFHQLREDIYVVAPYMDEQGNQEPETKAQETGIVTGPAGGLDIPLEYANKQCAAAPLLTTARPGWPVESRRITSGFGYRIHPITGDEGVHTGLDIAGDEGSPVYAAFYGTVAEVGQGKQFGNYIILSHAGGLQTVYAHCSAIIAEEGMVLRAGDVIARVGQTGAATGPHLHFEMRLDGRRFDPAPLLGALLPAA